MTNSGLFTYIIHVFQLMLDLLLKGDMFPILEFEKIAGGKSIYSEGVQNQIHETDDRKKNIPIRRQVY